MVVKYTLPKSTLSKNDFGFRWQLDTDDVESPRSDGGGHSDKGRGRISSLLSRLKFALATQQVARVLLVSSLSEFGVLATFASGLVLTSHGWLGLTCVQFWNFGFPYTWREVLSCGGTTVEFNWVPFLLDTIFYFTSGYAFAFVYARKTLLSTSKDRLVVLFSLGYIIGTLVMLALLSYTAAQAPL